MGGLGTFCLMVFGIILLAIGVFSAVSPEAALDVAGMSEEHLGGYIVEYDIDPDVARGVGAVIAVIGFGITIPGIVRVAKR